MDEEDIKMKQLQFGTSDETVSSVILGCMRLNGAENPQQVIETAYDHGITFLITPTFMVAATAKPFLVRL